MKKIVQLTALCAVLMWVMQGCSEQDPGLVKDEASLKLAIENAQPGDEIVLKNGVWKDIEIVFAANGTQSDTIVLRAQTPGEVFIEGQSNLGISGSYLHVTGLVFRNGYTPTSDVIAFRTNKETLANHVRVSHCVIDNFSNPERYESDIWVTMFGKNNRFDHNNLIGKRNRGVTMAVRLNTEASQENNHRIDYNYFGPRQNLASNGGETLRIGTSHYSLTNSNSTVSFNYFDECDGELEIISNKSGGNKYLSNVFNKSKGTLTMRHGKNTLVENNYFIGARKANTGGIRVINEYQTVKNNYLIGLTGHRFRGALVVMNGVPNSPINRYNQVVDATIEGNVLIDCDHVQLCAGSDEERSAIPVGTKFENNIMMSKTNANLFTVYDDISGIAFSNNVTGTENNPPSEEGFVKVDNRIEPNENGVLLPSVATMELAGLGQNWKLPVQKKKTGAAYYTKKGLGPAFGSGKTTKVAPGTNTLVEAALQSAPGDVLVLENGAEYLLTKTVALHHPLTIMADKGTQPRLLAEKSTFFKIENEGSLELINLIIDGAQSPDQPGNAVVSTSKYSMNRNYKLKVIDCKVQDLKINHSFNFLKIYPSTMADTIEIRGSDFSDVTGSILSMATETDDLGMYNAEYVLIKQSKFNSIGGAVADIYRGGRDESTFGPNVYINECNFIEVGNDKRNKIKASMRFLGVQRLDISNSQWESSAGVKLQLTNGEPISNLNDLSFENTPDVVSNGSYNRSNIKIEGN